MGAAEVRANPTKDDIWIHSACDMCYCPCGIRVHRVDGVVVKIEGDPDCPHNWGRICAKGQAALMSLYNPQRVTKPLSRTNPEKGIGVDPKWVEISWEEALDIVTERLKKIRAEDPRKLLLATFDVHNIVSACVAWASAFGTPNTNWLAATWCGAALHMSTYLTNGTFHSEVDLEHCNYCILFGNQMGFMVGLNPNIHAQKMAEARTRGMKLVVVDPRCSNAAAKADEWIPIRPGTDGALALALVNVILNELGVYDVEFIKRRTNGSYLVGPDGRYVRDTTSKKPLIWDVATGQAKPYDAEIREPAIEGSFVVKDIQCRPAFAIMREHIRQYSAESVSQVTTVPIETIRRIAREFAEAARIGSTIVIDGVELPYRPVAVNAYRGAQAHKHGAHAALSMQLLNLIVGAFYVPGGHRGTNAVGPSGAWSPQEGHDGLITAGRGVNYIGRDPYEYRELELRTPQSLDLKELVPLDVEHPGAAVQLTLLEPKKFRMPVVPEALIHCRTNLVASLMDPEATAEALRKIPFMVSFANLLDETVQFADIVLPDLHWLERLELHPNLVLLSMSPSTGYWYWGIAQPVVEPPPGARHWEEVLMEIADRLGFLEDFYEITNDVFGIQEPYRLDPAKKYTREEILDLRAKSVCGPEHGLAWFKEHGYLKVKRTVAEMYPGRSIKAKVPIYYEHFLEVGDYVKKVAQITDISWDVSDYKPVLDWRPCPAYEEKDPERDLYAVNYKLPFHTFTHTAANPWLNELSEHHPYAYSVQINTETAKRKGIEDGDPIWLEQGPGRRVKGKARVTELIHPEVVGIAGTFGLWSDGRPVSKGKGVHFNRLVPLSVKQLDSMTLGPDGCVRVKVYKAR